MRPKVEGAIVRRGRMGHRLSMEDRPRYLSCPAVLAPLRVLPFPVGLSRDVTHVRDDPFPGIPILRSCRVRVVNGEEGGPSDDVVLGPAGHLGLQGGPPGGLRRPPGFYPMEGGEPQAGVRFPRTQKRGAGAT